MAPPAAVRIIGSYLSPYVRKVLVALDWKGVPYQIDPIVPFFGDERFSKASPIRRVPVLIDDRVTLPDSTVSYEIDRSRWPRTASWVARTLALPSFEKLAPFEQKSARTPIPKQREALAAIGAPLTEESWGTATPRRGMMKI